METIGYSYRVVVGWGSVGYPVWEDDGGKGACCGADEDPERYSVDYSAGHCAGLRMRCRGAKEIGLVVLECCGLSIDLKFSLAQRHVPMHVPIHLESSMESLFHAIIKETK